MIKFVIAEMADSLYLVAKNSLVLLPKGSSHCDEYFMHTDRNKENTYEHWLYAGIQINIILVHWDGNVMILTKSRHWVSRE